VHTHGRGFRAKARHGGGFGRVNLPPTANLSTQPNQSRFPASVGAPLFLAMQHLSFIREEGPAPND
jgi:hypothetical protein